MNNDDKILLNVSDETASWNSMALKESWKQMRFIQAAVKAGFTPEQAQFMSMFLEPTDDAVTEVMHIINKT